MLNYKSLRGLFCLSGLVVATTAAQAQLPQTRLYAISPNGCQAGQSVDVRLNAGDDLEEVTKVLFTHPGLTAAQKMNEQGQPVDNTFVVSVAGDVPPGLYDLRCQGLFGVSNPRRFVVGQRTEILETESNDPTPAKASPLELNTVINGKMDGGTDIDWYRFTAKQGQIITFDCWAQRIDSKLDATLAIYDSTGRRQLKLVRDTQGADPVLAFAAPADGEYLLKLHDHQFRNGNEFVYRLETHTGPHIAFVLPPAGTAGATSRFALYGWNLPGGQPTQESLEKNIPLQKLDLDIAVPAQGDLADGEGRVSGTGAGIDTFAYRLSSPQGLSAPVRIGIARTSVVLEQELNTANEQSQTITVPCDVGGQFGTKGDSDNFRFAAKAGDVLWLEVIAQRQGSTADSQFTIDQVTVDGEGKEKLNRIAAVDDEATNLLPNVFDTRTDDPRYKFTAPAEATYQVTVRDRYWETRGGAGLVYRLVIRPETPDFRLAAIAAAPAAGQVFPVGLRQGDSFGVNVLAYRQDGFEGPIDVTVEGLPAGVTCAGTSISSKELAGLLVFHTTADAAPGWHSVKILGTAGVDDPALVRAEESAIKAIPEAEKPLPDLRKGADQLKQKLDQAAAQLADTEKALTDKPDDEGLKKQQEQRLQARDQAQKAFDEAQAKVVAQEQVVAAARTTRDAAVAARIAAAKPVSHVARTGTVIWPTANNIPAVARVADTFDFSIQPESSGFQVRLEGTRFEANQSRQLLIPVTLEKRNEFNDKVQLTAAGMPKTANIETPNIAVEKDQAQQVWRLFVKDNAPPGTYTAWLTAQGQVSYRRNPAKAERLKAAHEAVKVMVETLKTAAAEATKVKTDAVAKATEAQQAMQKAQQDQQGKQQAKQQADQKLTQAKQAKDTADAAFAAADKELQAKEAELKTVEEQLTVANTALQQAETELKAAQDALAAEPDNADKKAAVEQKQQAVTAAQQKVAEVTKARDTVKGVRDQAQTKRGTAETAAKQASEKFTTEETAAKQATEALTVAMKTFTESETANKTAQEAKTKAEQDEKAATDAAANKEKERQAAEKAATDADNAAKPKNLNHTPVAGPVVIVVKPAPVKLTAEVPNGGNLKVGEKLEIKVKVSRQNEFAGPLTLSLPLPPGIAGLAADTPTIAADQAEGMITVTATGDAPAGAISNLVVRGEMDFAGRAAVDVPVTVNVNK